MISEVPQESEKKTVPGVVLGGRQYFYLYDPQADITAFELAEVMKVLMLVPLVLAKAAPPDAVDAMVFSLSDGAKRHFKVQKNSGIVVPHRG